MRMRVTSYPRRPFRPAPVGVLALLLALCSLALAYAPRGTAQGTPMAEAVWTRSFPAPEAWSRPPASLAVTAVDTPALQPASAAYRYSTDGGSSWSPWLSDATLQVGSPDPATVQMTATIASLVESSTLNQIAFRVEDQAGNTETSTAFILQVDNTAPAAPVSLTSSPAGWTNADSFSLS